MTPTTALDPISIEILWNRLASIAEQQARALYNGSFSTSTSEVEDYCSTLHDIRGRMIAQSVSSGTISMLTGQTKSIKFLAQRFSESVKQGDAIIWNDPWTLAGHKYDVLMASPIFHQQMLVGWAVTSLHAADIGGRGFSAASQDTYEEGLTFPPLKFYRAGVPNTDLLDLIRANVRVPDQVIGDFMAQVAANEVGASKVVALLDEYELADLERIADEIITRSEAVIRAAIAAIPKGTYSHTVELDGFDAPLQVKCTLTFNGTDVVADLAGTSQQVAGAINAVGQVAYGRVAHALKCVLAARIPNNEGLFRPIQVNAPEGSLVNARFPAATAARHVLHFFISAATFGALAKIEPPLGGLIADSGSGLIQSVRERDSTGIPQDYWIQFNHGMGATPHQDGYSGMCAPNNVATTPIEIMEARTKILFLKKEIVCDAGGPGKYRGGNGQEYAFKVVSDQPTTVSCMFDYVDHPPQGYLGGLNGAPTIVMINDEAVHPKGQYTLHEEDVMTVRGPGGGGFFPPAQRDPTLVLEDVVNGFISEEVARKTYLVAVDLPAGHIDLKETRRLRAIDLETGAQSLDPASDRKSPSPYPATPNSQSGIENA